MTSDQPASSRKPTASNDENDRFSIVAISEHSEFELLDSTAKIGYAKYQRQDDSIVFTHTVVDGGYEGMGLGSRLAKHVLDDAVAQGLRIVPVCSFIAAYVRRHHEYDAHLDWPDTEAVSTGDRSDG